MAEWYVYAAGIFTAGLGLIVVYWFLRKQNIIGSIPVFSGIVDPLVLGDVSMSSSKKTDWKYVPAHRNYGFQEDTLFTEMKAGKWMAVGRDDDGFWYQSYGKEGHVFDEKGGFRHTNTLIETLEREENLKITQKQLARLRPKKEQI